MRAHTGASGPTFVLDNYIPDLPTEDWQFIREFVLDAVADAADHLTYPDSAVINAVAHHVDWCVHVAGYSLARHTVFRRDIISAGALMMPSTNSGSRGQRRSLLLRVGEVLDVIPVVPPLPPLAAASPSAPYTPDDIEGITHWASRQPERTQASAWVLVAVTFGAGLPPRELCTLRAGDVGVAGSVIRLAERTIPVLDDWQDELCRLAVGAAEQDAPLFRPTVTWHKNMVTNFISNSANEGLRPSPQRMRATWLVEHMSAGTPMQDLLAWAGLKSMDALVRYERFLPPPSPVALEGTN